MSKKHTFSSATSMQKAALMIGRGANKRTVSTLLGRNIADAMEYNDIRTTKKGLRSWLRGKDGIHAANLIVDIAINYYNFDPLQPKISFLKMDFTHFVTLLNMAGYEDHTVNVNKAVEVLDDLMTIDDKDTCIACERPYIIPPTFDPKCPRCRMSSNRAALERYSASSLDYSEDASYTRSLHSEQSMDSITDND
ncbi:hypothetical protein EEAAV_26245 (plasmid) [Rahnella aceris]